MADRGDDRDGLRLDQLHLPLGPVLPDWPAGLVLRVITQIAYRPALFYIDTLKYLFNAFPGTDPVGYKVPLYPMVFFGGLPGIAVVQHLLGLAA